MMSKQAIKLVKRHNKWRRGGKGKMADPKRLGEAIDAVVAMTERCESLEAAIRQTLDENAHLADGDVCTLLVLKRSIGWE